MTRQPSAISQTRRGDQAGSEKAQADVEIDVPPLRAQRSRVNQHQPWNRTEEQENHSGANQRLALTQTLAHEPEQQQDGSHDAGNGVQQHHSGIENVRLRERVKVNCGQRKESQSATTAFGSQNSG